MQTIFQRSCTLIICLILSNTVFGQWNQVVDTKVSFFLKNAGIGVNGKFEKVDATAQFNEKKLTSSMFTGKVHVATVRTGIALRDNHIRDKAEFFDVKNFPIIEMKSISVQPNSKAGEFLVEWLLTMKGVSKKLSSIVSTIVKQDKLMASTNFKINRRDWKVGDKGILMNDIVTIQLTATLIK